MGCDLPAAFEKAEPGSHVLTGLPAIVFPQVQLSRLLLAAKRRTPVQRMDPSSCTKQIMREQ